MRSSSSPSTQRNTEGVDYAEADLLLQVVSIGNTTHVNLSPLIRFTESCDNPTGTVLISPTQTENLNYIAFATLVFRAIVTYDKPCLNVIIQRPPVSSLSPQNHHPRSDSNDDGIWKSLEDVDDEEHLLTLTESKHDIVAVGGTFDRLHAGHRLLLTVAAWITSSTLLIGITDDSLISHKKHSNIIASVDRRGHDAIEYVQCITPHPPDIKLSVLYNSAGLSATHPSINALVVSRETLCSANRINESRNERGLNRFAIVVVDVLHHHDSAKLSSTALRERAAIEHKQIQQKESNNEDTHTENS